MEAHAVGFEDARHLPDAVDERARLLVGDRLARRDVARGAFEAHGARGAAARDLEVDGHDRVARERQRVVDDELHRLGRLALGREVQGDVRHRVVRDDVADVGRLAVAVLHVLADGVGRAAAVGVVRVVREEIPPAAFEIADRGRGATGHRQGRERLGAVDEAAGGVEILLLEIGAAADRAREEERPHALLEVAAPLADENGQLGLLELPLGERPEVLEAAVGDLISPLEEPLRLADHLRLVGVGDGDVVPVHREKDVRGEVRAFGGDHVLDGLLEAFGVVEARGVAQLEREVLAGEAVGGAEGRLVEFAPHVVFVEDAAGGHGAVDLVVPVVARVDREAARREAGAVGRGPDPLGVAFVVADAAVEHHVLEAEVGEDLRELPRLAPGGRRVGDGAGLAAVPFDRLAAENHVAHQRLVADAELLRERVVGPEDQAAALDELLHERTALRTHLEIVVHHDAVAVHREGGVVGVLLEDVERGVEHVEQMAAGLLEGVSELPVPMRVGDDEDLADVA